MKTAAKAVDKPANGAASTATKAKAIPGIAGGKLVAEGQAAGAVGRGPVVARAAVYEMPPQARIDLIKQGVPAKHLSQLAADMDISKDALIDTLRISRATVNRKARDNKPLSQDESERVLGVDFLIGQVENMVRESGDPAGFDAARWVSNWLNSPLPALGGRHPASYMDTVEGQKMVSDLLATAQSGAYT